MDKLSIQGKESKKENFIRDYSFDGSSFEIVQSIKVNALRGETDQVEIDGKEEDIIHLVFDDNAEWIGPIEDIAEIYGLNYVKKRSGSSGEFMLPTQLGSSDERGIAEWGIKLLSVFRKRNNLPVLAGNKLGKLLDKKLMPKPGLFRLNADFQLVSFDQVEGSNPILLFIHGTISSTEGSFGHIYKVSENDGTPTALWNQIQNTYGENILALEHRTVSVHPVQNVIDILSGLPHAATLDIISHSRGGIVADILARCDQRNDMIGFSDQELNKIKKEDTDSYKLLVQLNTLLESKRVTIKKVIRVACPAYGTLLLSDRLDHFLNGLLRAVGLLFGGEANRIYGILREFTMDVVKSRTNPGTLPGLLSMVPGSPLQDVLNNVLATVKSHLVTIEGNSEFGGSVGHSIKVIFSNLFYLKANDFVVNTDSMRLGVRRESGLQYVMSKDSDTSHFNYFKNENTRNFILTALKTEPGLDIKGFTKYPILSAERGIALDFINLGEERGTRISGNKPIVILIPGIMGSNIAADDKKIWLDFGEIGKGKLADAIHSDAPNVSASSLIARFYSPMVKALRDRYDVEVFPYDWRKSLKGAARQLKDRIAELSKHGQAIKIVAHSMGGVLTRTMMIEHQADWNAYIEKKGSRFVMLGTPWMGSYGIVELLTGKARSLRQLSIIDMFHSKKELLKVIGKYPGVYELLPIDDRKIESKEFWDQIKKEWGNDSMLIPELLDHFKKFKAAVKKQQLEFKNIYYIAGSDKSTIEDYEIVPSVFGNRLKFTKTAKGDGTVTWEKGIPKEIPTENVYYVDTVHGNLARDSKNFDGIEQILDKGRTNRLLDSPILSRGEMRAIDTSEMVSNNLEDAADILLGAFEVQDGKPKKQEVLDVEVTHADLKVARYPVIVGHFENDDLVSAERAIDNRFDGKLSERHAVGNYPEQVGFNTILFNSKKQPAGTLVVGLGNPTKLTAHHLMNTVRAGILNYAMFIRDNNFDEKKGKFSNGISSLCVGAGYGRLPLESALQAILIGINRANEAMSELNGNLMKIKKVQFIEMYEDRANEAYYCIKRISEGQSNLMIKVKRGVAKAFGAKRRLQYGRQEVWWHNFSTQKVPADQTDDNKPRLLFRSSSGIARVEQKNVFTSEAVVNALLSEFSKSPQWDPELSKTLFELLIPIDFKEIIRSQNNVLWKMDVETASIPWEMFHDIEYDEEPTFINAGLIRQLTTDNFRRNPDLIRTNSALVIGDPIYDGDLPQLDAAKNEAVEVHGLLSKSGFTSKDFIRRKGTEILKSIYNEEFRLLHIAGHGIFDPENNKIGVALGNGMFLSPAMIGNFTKVPQFVFLNCCHSGFMDSKFERYYENRYRFAANIGTELIKLGTEAVVVTGWAVDDHAAKMFANKFYELMLDGYAFGEAVQKARNSCYKAYPASNTWGAYQCYGNPWYKMVAKSTWKKTKKNYISNEEVLVDLDNLLVETEHIKIENVPYIKDELIFITEGARDARLYSGPVIEREARIYDSIDEIDLAVDRYYQMLSLNKADFKVSSLEQFCNLRAKQMVRNGKKDIASINKILSDLKLLLSIGETPERLSLMGSAYKRFAQVSSGSKRTGYLKNMIKCYKEAYMMQKDQIKASIYPLANWLTAIALTDHKTSIEIENKKIKSLDYLEEVEKRLRDEIMEFNDFWEDINIVNVLMCQMLFSRSRNKKSIAAFRYRIVHHYLHAWKLGGNFDNARTEIEHIDFIITIASGRKDFMWETKIEQLNEIKSQLEALMTRQDLPSSDESTEMPESKSVESDKPKVHNVT